MADVNTVHGLGGISGDLPQRGKGFTPKRKSQTGVSKESQSEPEQVPNDSLENDLATQATRKLIEALDRLRATTEMGPAENELVRTLRGAKYYQDESRYGIKALPDPDDVSDEPPTGIGNQHLA